MKYILHVTNDIKLAIKHNEEKEILFFGGDKKYSLEIRMFLENYFMVDFDNETYFHKYPQTNKSKYEVIKYDSKRFYDSIKRLKNKKYRLDFVKSLDRLMG